MCVPHTDRGKRRGGQERGQIATPVGAALEPLTRGTVAYSRRNSATL